MPYDMRKTLLKPGSKIRRMSKDGHAYGYVPFRHSTPGSRGKAGPPMGSPYAERGDLSLAGTGRLGPQIALSVQRATAPMSREQAHKVGQRVHRQAARLGGTVSAGAVTIWGGRLKAGSGNATARARGGVKAGVRKLYRHHTTDIYQGMVKKQHVYKKAVQSQYMTWRTISEKSKVGWMHPGIMPRHLAPKVQQYVETQAPRVIRRTITAAVNHRGLKQIL